MKSSQRTAFIVMMCAGVVFLIASWGSVLSGRRAANFLELMFPVVYLVAAGLFTLRAFHDQVRLSDNAIELHELKGDLALPLDKIKGRRRYLEQGDQYAPRVWHLVLEPNDDNFPRLDIEELYRFDDAFYQWFNQLPDLDEADKHKPKTSNFGLA